MNDEQTIHDATDTPRDAHLKFWLNGRTVGDAEAGLLWPAALGDFGQGVGAAFSVKKRL